LRSLDDDDDDEYQRCVEPLVDGDIDAAAALSHVCSSSRAEPVKVETIFLP